MLDTPFPFLSVKDDINFIPVKERQRAYAWPWNAPRSADRGAYSCARATSGAANYHSDGCKAPLEHHRSAGGLARANAYLVKTF